MLLLFLGKDVSSFPPKTIVLLILGSIDGNGVDGTGVNGGKVGKTVDGTVVGEIMGGGIPFVTI